MGAVPSLMHRGETPRSECCVGASLHGEDAGRAGGGEAGYPLLRRRCVAMLLVRRRPASIKHRESARARWVGSVRRTPKGLTLKREDAEENPTWSFLTARWRS